MICLAAFTPWGTNTNIDGFDGREDASNTVKWFPCVQKTFPLVLGEAALAEQRARVVS